MLKFPAPIEQFLLYIGTTSWNHIPLDVPAHIIVAILFFVFFRRGMKLSLSATLMTIFTLAVFKEIHDFPDLKRETMWVEPPKDILVTMLGAYAVMLFSPRRVK